MDCEAPVNSAEFVTCTVAAMESYTAIWLAAVGAIVAAELALFGFLWFKRLMKAGSEE